MTSKPHDAFFKVLFHNPSTAAELFREHLPADLERDIDWSTLTLMPGSNLGRPHDGGRSLLLRRRRLEQALADAPVHLSLVGSPLLLRRAIDLEHQSQSIRLMAYRLMKYVVRILERHFDPDTDESLPLVLPLVVSRDPRGWTAPRSLHDLHHPHPDRTGHPECVLNLHYFLDDVSHLTNEELCGRALSAMAKLGLALQRDARNADVLTRHPVEWADLYKAVIGAENGLAAIAVMLRYVSGLLEEVNFDQFRGRILEHIREVRKEESAVNEIKNDTLSWAESHELRGFEKGRNEGRKEARNEGEIVLLERQLVRKFGPLSPEQHDRLRTASESERLEFAERLLDAASVAAVFDSPPG